MWWVTNLKCEQQTRPQFSEINPDAADVDAVAVADATVFLFALFASASRFQLYLPCLERLTARGFPITSVYSK